MRIQGLFPSFWDFSVILGSKLPCNHLFVASRLAPARMRAVTTAGFPFIAATISGVLPVERLLEHCMSAPNRTYITAFIDNQKVSN